MLDSTHIDERIYLYHIHLGLRKQEVVNLLGSSERSRRSQAVVFIISDQSYHGSIRSLLSLYYIEVTIYYSITTMSVDTQTQINELNAAVATLNSSFTQMTGNTLMNFNQLSKINSRQSNITSAISSSTGVINTLGFDCANVQGNNGLGLGKRDNTLTGILQMNDNFLNTKVSYTLNAAALPFREFTRQTVFMFQNSLTVGSASTIFTLTHRTGSGERFIYIYIDGMICGSSSFESSTKTFNAYIVGSRSDNSALAYTYTTTQLSSATSATNAASLQLGATTISFPTNTDVSTIFALTQSMTAGTPSQRMYITGKCTIYVSNNTGTATMNTIVV